MNERKDRVRVHLGGQEYNVVGGAFQEMLAAIKQINGRRFVSELKVWQLPGTAEEIQRQLDISGYRLEGGTPIAAASSSSVTPAAAGSDRIRLSIDGRRLAVIGGSFQDMLAVVKNLPGRRFDADTKLWEISGDVGVIKGIIEAAGLQLEGSENIPISTVPPMEPPDFSPSKRVSPPPYQPPDFLGGSEPVITSDEELIWDDDEEQEPPDWWDDRFAPPPFEEDLFEEPPTFDYEPPSAPPKSALPLPPAAASGPRGGDRVRLRLGELALVVSGGSFQEMLAVVKNIPGRRFEADTRAWAIPDTVSLEALHQQLTTAGFVLEQE